MRYIPKLVDLTKFWYELKYWWRDVMIVLGIVGGLMLASFIAGAWIF